MLNIVAVMGRLARDPEMRQTTTGKSVASFTIACDRGRRDANGQSVCDWLNIVAWDKTAEFVCKYFQKGSMIAVDGRLQSRSYQDKNGQNRTAVEIVANNVNFCGSKESASPAPQNAAQRTQGEPDADYATIDDDEGDLPF
jgi:single-strand DNA-binding protein